MTHCLVCKPSEILFQNCKFKTFFHQARRTYLFYQVNASLQIHSKVNKVPLNSLLLVFLLFYYKHMVVEELLESLVCIIDAQLFKCIVLKQKGIIVS